MIKLYITTIKIPSAGSGGDNPLTPLNFLINELGVSRVASDIPKEDIKYLGYGIQSHCLPYTIQDGYDRKLEIREFKVAVMENNFVKAVFLLEYGARLWSLFDKISNKELLYTNPVFQPANLARRNAWFSGGIEWNFAVPGHGPFTFSNVFAAKCRGPQGVDALRIYEYERITGLPFQIDFYLLQDSSYLFAQISFENLHSYEVPMYWWTNAAVRQSPGTRIIVPAENAYVFGYERIMRNISLPVNSGIDITYPANSQYAMDYFYRINNSGYPWQAAIEADGSGIANCSTQMLKGRKLFVWGSNEGGNNWQRFLSRPGNPYYTEIQAGLCRTQSECIPIPPKTKWSWLEAWGAIKTDPDKIHNDDWSISQKECESQLANLLENNFLENQLINLTPYSQQPTQEIMHYGSGWGALEEAARSNKGLRPLSRGQIVFPKDSIGKQQKPWFDLFDKKEFPCPDTEDEFTGWSVDSVFQELLQAAIVKNQKDNWFAHFNLGIIYYAKKDFSAAEKEWQESILCKPSAWAYRNLAILYRQIERPDDSLNSYSKAIELKPHLLPLLIEYADTLLKYCKFNEIQNFIKKIPTNLVYNARLQLILAQALLAFDKLDECEKIILQLEIVDIRECENNLSDIWQKLQIRKFMINNPGLSQEKCQEYVSENCLIPEKLNFKMF